MKSVLLNVSSFVQQRFRLNEIRGIESFGKPTIDFPQHLPTLFLFALSFS